MSLPPGSMDSSPPSSTKRANDLHAACDVLSADGAAAVLAYARTMIDRNRRYPSILQNVDLWKFVWAIRDVAADMKDFVVIKNGKYRRELVFVASVHRQLQARGDAAAMSLMAFKARVLEARLNKMMILDRCRHPENVSPLLLEASTIQMPRGPMHLIERDKMTNVHEALEHATHLLPDSARPVVASFARRVHADEALRDGRPRLITLTAEKFARRIQEFVDQNYEDMPISQLYWQLEGRGEMTGLDVETFKQWLLVAHRAGRLRLGEQTDGIRHDALLMSTPMIRDDGITYAVVRRANLRPPIPWGPPNPPIIRRLVLHAP